MLHKLHRIFVIQLVEEELVQFQKLIALNVLGLLGTANVCHLRDSVGEFQVHEGKDPIKDAFRLDVLGLMGSLRVFCNWFGSLLHNTIY